MDPDWYLIPTFWPRVGLTSPAVPPYIQESKGRFFPVLRSESIFNFSGFILLDRGYWVRHTGPIPLDEYFIWRHITENPYKILTNYKESLPYNLFLVLR